MELSQDDLAPFIGRIVLENLTLSKEVERLRAHLAELEAALDAKRYVDGIAGAPV
jgi:hypothetical protein